MPEVSRQRRDIARRVAGLLADPSFRSRNGLDEDSEVPVLVALWTDQLAPLLEQVAALGQHALICVKAPNGAINSMNIRASENRDENEQFKSAPTSTIGMLIDSIGETTSFDLSIEDSELDLGAYQLEFATTALSPKAEGSET